MFVEMARSVKDFSFDDGKARICALLKGDNKRKQQGDELEILTEMQRDVSLMCPLTMCRVEGAAVGRDCKHLQFFDLRAYLTVNAQNRNLNNR